MIVGIDTGARRLAFCALDDDGSYFGWYETPQASDAEELEDLQWWLVNQLNRPILGLDVFLEKVVVPHGRATSLDGVVRHSMTVGVVLATVGGELIAPATWKANILGYGHADKHDIECWVRDTSPEVAAAIQAAATTKARRADLYDAYCIALHGHAQRGRDLGVERAERVR